MRGDMGRDGAVRGGVRVDMGRYGAMALVGTHPRPVVGTSTTSSFGWRYCAAPLAKLCAAAAAEMTGSARALLSVICRARNARAEIECEVGVAY